jgi:hypothetical protein
MDKDDLLHFSEYQKTLRLRSIDTNFSHPCHPAHFVLKRSDFSFPVSERNMKPFEVTAVESPDWTVLVIVFDHFYEYFLNWLAHYRKLILSHLDVVIVAGDDLAVKKLRAEPRIPANFHLVDTSVGTETAGSIPSSYGRSIEVAQVHSISEWLERGQNIIYTDIRTVWLSDPVPLIQSLQEIDIIADADGSTSGAETPRYNTRFLAIRTNERTIAFMKEWRIALQSSKWNEGTFNILMYRAFVHRISFPPAEFQKGSEICSPLPQHPPEKAVVVHSIDKSPHLKTKIRCHNRTMWLLGQNESVGCEQACNTSLLTMTTTLLPANKGTQKYGIQVNTLKAITKLRPEVDIVVFSKAQEVHDMCRLLGIRVVEDCGTNPYGTPFLHSLFQI